jgi:hypothetical protein
MINQFLIEIKEIQFNFILNIQVQVMKFLMGHETLSH